jgi:signal transduction histidine kinase
MHTNANNESKWAVGRFRNWRGPDVIEPSVQVLLVDSDRRNLAILEDVLHSRDCSLSCAETADEALRAVALQEFALLVLNVHMSETSGLELARIIRSRSRTRQLPIIFLSARYPEDEAALKAFAGGPVDYMPLPCNPTVLRSKAYVFAELYRKKRALLLEIGARVRMNRQLTERTTEVQQLVLQLRALTLELNRAAQRERRRIATLLHDHQQQFLVSAKMQLARLEARTDSAQSRRMLANVRDAIEEAIAVSRAVTTELSPPILDDARLPAALEWLAGQMKKAHEFTVNLQSDHSLGPISEDARLLLFECTRELLLNAIKHSGVSEADVELSVTQDGRIRILVQDMGNGFDTDQLPSVNDGHASFGLFSIQQRLAYFGGELVIKSAPRFGTLAAICLPLDALAEEEPRINARGNGMSLALNDGGNWAAHS